jgi:hypothetical protein
MSQDSDAHAYGAAILDGNEVWTRRFQDDIVTNPDVLPNLHSSGAMEQDAKSLRPRQYPSQMLQYTIFQTTKGAFFH